MNVRIKFLGAAQSVTGSKYLLEIDNYKLMVDCGMFQGPKELRLRNWNKLPIEEDSIDAVILTHAHIDHSGYLPRLVKNGFKGPIYCTEATEGLLRILLLDAAKLQEEEAEFAKKKGYSKHNTPEPLFNTEDAENVLLMLKTAPYDLTNRVNDFISFNFNNAGHILGSSIVELFVQGEQQQKKLVFSGDLGGYNQPLLKTPAAITDADILLVESTYGGKANDHTNFETIFANKVNEALDKGGCLLIPSFAVGRTQLLLYYFQKLQSQGLIPNYPVYVDSPMAISTTFLYQQYPKYHTLTPEAFQGDGLFDYPTIKYYKSQESSVSINDLRSKAIIISASGMCTGGRILHHLYHRLSRKNDTVLFVGYQAYGTRGRRLVDGETSVRIFGIDVPVKCHIDNLMGLSAHADMNELHQWLSNFTSPPKMTFVVHGEVENSIALANYLRMDSGWDNVYIPNYLESFELFRGI
ncbi:MBL fold metallo-hydrolase RNA specificity domain-containing protein [Fulvivirga lutimaris]|uniref:MBL fold metallo-hydrolase RNA specificity domain-containing protein n=1 Tax=Fulvivirga lutimaris TaxID=1819566 RepID=UPI0012BD3F79|nr:MBL fold metallo-hydrolase [Fulvivirga lutimaris]MTI39463.1 MBL fold metallo-hydrolase [Fulvivirga lutimaris]